MGTVPTIFALLLEECNASQPKAQDLLIFTKRYAWCTSKTFDALELDRCTHAKYAHWPDLRWPVKLQTCPHRYGSARLHAGA